MSKQEAVRFCRRLAQANENSYVVLRDGETRQYEVAGYSAYRVGLFAGWELVCCCDPDGTTEE